MDTLDREQTRKYFRAVCERFPVAKDAVSVVVTHLLRDRPFFLEAVDRLAPIALIVPKPKSFDFETRQWLSQRYHVEPRTREDLEDSKSAVKLVEKYGNGRPVIILDIGGYFAASLDAIGREYSPGLVGVVEDTENGHQRYQKLGMAPCPIVSVARSPLKDVEDYLVGQSIVFSVEALLREQGDILQGRTACVIGFGKVGRSIASLLHSRHVRVVVADNDCIRVVQAMSQGFFALNSVREGLQGAGMVFCATGNVALTSDMFRELIPGAYVATVTSSDDELDLSRIREDYEARQISEHITRYDSTDGYFVGHHFFLLNRGQAVNFIHGAAVGPFIYLVQGELLASMSAVVDSPSLGFFENRTDLRKAVAKIWHECYGSPLS